MDCGTPINPDLAAGQLEGGLSRGISLALLEDTEYEPETGQLTCGGSFVDYKVFTAEDMLPLENIETFFADTYEPSGPFGAKGVGEAANNCTAGTVANAIYNAIGLRLRKTPITPEKILDALKNGEKKDEGRNNDQL